MKRRLVILGLCAVFCAVAVTTASASPQREDSLLPELTRSVLGLLFDTDNVTLKVEATFLLDGEWFKTAHIVLKQDGTQSIQQVLLDTPRIGRAVYQGGYTVHGDGDKAYAVETWGGPFYTEHPHVPDHSVVRKTALSQAAASFAEQFSVLLNDSVGKAMTVTDEGGEKVFRLSLGVGEIPAVFNAAFNLATTAWAKMHYSGYGEQTSVEYEDWEALFAHYYQELIGEPMPEGFFDAAMMGQEELWHTYEAIAQTMQEDYQAAVTRYDSGLVLFRADGQLEWFATRADYLRSEGLVFVHYEDAQAAFQPYYEKTFGTPLSEDFLAIIPYTSNEALLKAYSDLWQEMDASYKKLAEEDPNAVAVYVGADGSWTLLDSTDDMDGLTVTRKLMGTLVQITLSSAEGEMMLDSENRPMSIKGDVSFAVTDALDVTRSLQVSFHLDASHYGKTLVPAFNPEDYAVVSQDEYWYPFTEEGMAPVSFPEKVTFAGKEYASMVDFR